MGAPPGGTWTGAYGVFGPSPLQRLLAIAYDYGRIPLEPGV